MSKDDDELAGRVAGIHIGLSGRDLIKSVRAIEWHA